MVWPLPLDQDMGNRGTLLVQGYVRERLDKKESFCLQLNERKNNMNEKIKKTSAAWSYLQTLGIGCNTSKQRL